MKSWLKELDSHGLRKQRRRRRGFTMLLLAVAAASICTVTVSTQSSGTQYDRMMMRQMMRNEQARWLAQGFQEMAFGLDCRPPAGPQPALPNTWVLRPTEARYTIGDVGSAPQERILVRLSNNFGSTADFDVEVRVYNNPALTGTPVVEKEINVRTMNYEPDVTTGGQRVIEQWGRQRTGWTNTDWDQL